MTNKEPMDNAGPVSCGSCGKELTELELLAEGLRQIQICRRCDFWLGKCDAGGFVIDGSHYLVGPEDDVSFFRGFNGRRFVIEAEDGRRIVTTNLWCQGKVPDHFRQMFPDNARFVEEEASGMDIICTRCGEPWELETVLHDQASGFDRKGCRINVCRSCRGKPSPTLSGRTLRQLLAIAEVADLFDEDLDGFAATLADLGLAD